MFELFYKNIEKNLTECSSIGTTTELLSDFEGDICKVKGALS